MTDIDASSFALLGVRRSDGDAVWRHGCRAAHAGQCGTAAGARGWDLVPDILRRIVPPTFPDRDFDVTRYGAQAGGAVDNTDGDSRRDRRVRRGRRRSRRRPGGSVSHRAGASQEPT